MPFDIIDNQEILLNSSKSMLIRQLVLAFLYQNTIPDVSLDDSGDVKVVYNCLQHFNKPLQLSNKEYIIIDVKDCGAAYRFLMAVASVTPGRWLITGSDRLLARPIMPLVDALQSLGADIQPVDNGWLLQGKELHASQVKINCTESSQFASALILISKRVGLQEIRILPSPAPSAPYIQMTQNLLDFSIKGRPVDREGDWSTAAFWYAFLALSDDVSRLLLKDLRLDSVQGGRIVAHWMEPLGIRSLQTAEGVLISKESLLSPRNGELEFDLTDHPDLAPVLAVLAALLPCQMRLSGLSTLNGKESRRLDVLATELLPFAEVKTMGGSELTIISKPKVTLRQPLILDTHNDHRMAMAFLLISLKYKVLYTDLSCVKKSYPGFENYFKAVPTFKK